MFHPFKALIIADESEPLRDLCSELVRSGFSYSVTASESSTVAEQLRGQALDVVLIATNGLPTTSKMWQLPRRIKQERRLPVIALLSRGVLGSLNPGVGIDDFVVDPWEPPEVIFRMRRALWQVSNLDSEELIKCGNLVIDIAKCEVSVSGRRVTLTFKEYELLRFLASNKERVFTRDALLNEIWGYDYFGGDRTVDVHIRRLRSKIETGEHSFIETVRNVGYKFRKEV